MSLGVEVVREDRGVMVLEEDRGVLVEGVKEAALFREELGVLGDGVVCRFLFLY